MVRPPHRVLCNIPSGCSIYLHAVELGIVVCQQYRLNLIRCMDAITKGGYVLTLAGESLGELRS